MASFKGGAVFAEQGAHITVSQTHITDNRSDYGTVLYVDSTNSSNDIVFDQNLVVHNGRGGAGEYADFNAFNLYNNSSIVSDDNLSFLVRHNTIVDNHLTQAVFTLNGVKNYLGVFSSILHDPTSPQIGNMMGAFSSAEFDCVNVNETVSISGGYSTLTRVNADDPGFVVRNYDYHLQERAATVDFCDNSRITGITISNDLDNHARPFNDTGFPDFYGPWDLGSDEHAGTSQPNDVIFIDSFDW
jgi:hypothetical protein